MKELQPSKFDVGIQVGESTIRPMASFKSPLSFMINLRERALFLYFQSTVKSASKKAGKEDKETQSFFRLKVPLFRLTRIWKLENEDSKEVSFLIILDSPPVYHRQLENFKATFQSDTSWRETDTWYRQTSIAHETGVEKYMATNLSRPEQIINIGELHRFKDLMLRFEINRFSQVDGMCSRSPYPLALRKPEPSSCLVRSFKTTISKSKTTTTSRKHGICLPPCGDGSILSPNQGPLALVA